MNIFILYALFRYSGLPFVHCRYFICASKFYAGKYVKITRYWKYNPKGEKGKGGRVGVGGPIMLRPKTVRGAGKEGSRESATSGATRLANYHSS